MQSYTEATEHQKIAFEALKQKDKKTSREIEMQAKKLQKLQVAAGCRGGCGSGDTPVPLLTFRLSLGLGHSHQGPDRGSPPRERKAEPACTGGEGKCPQAAPGAQERDEAGQGYGPRQPGQAHHTEQRCPEGSGAGGGEGEASSPRAGRGGTGGVLPSPPTVPSLAPPLPRPSASCGWPRCAASWRQRRKRCCPSTLPLWRKGSSETLSKSLRRHPRSPWPR